ncbi:hypothetical protein vBEliSR6L_16 [Erythrobacter phage vB_EliS_R6L]|nr:hypothetical protein vBEliSR6L_16 [Erythrobacter phage vB_EliS_R6L]
MTRWQMMLLAAVALVVTIWANGQTNPRHLIAVGLIGLAIGYALASRVRR